MLFLFALTACIDPAFDLVMIGGEFGVHLTGPASYPGACSPAGDFHNSSTKNTNQLIHFSKTLWKSEFMIDINPEALFMPKNLFPTS
ncbi:MAG: hypothetical protein AB9866_00700 [Syntrophobacteraceae bacterium]